MKRVNTGVAEGYIEHERVQGVGIYFASDSSRQRTLQAGMVCAFLRINIPACRVKSGGACTTAASWGEGASCTLVMRG
jgi:hypothetical protein